MLKSKVGEAGDGTLLVVLLVYNENKIPKLFWCTHEVAGEVIQLNLSQGSARRSAKPVAKSLCLISFSDPLVCSTGNSILCTGITLSQLNS